MGGSEKQQTQQTQTNTLDPQLKGLLMDNYATAQNKAASLTPYTGQLTAGFTPAQTQAQGILSSVGTNPLYGQTANNATAGAQGILNSNPLSAQDLQTYMNPFQNDVINASINENERARQIAQNQMNAQNAAGGAFGGSRSGVANALTNEAYDRNNQSNIASLNSTNYTQAQNASLAAKNLGLNAATTTANLNNNALGVAAQQGGILGAVGDAQQQQQQAELTNAYNAYSQGQQLTIAQQQLLDQALGLMPQNQGTTTASGSSTTSNNPGLGGILASVGKIGLSAAMI